MVSRLASLECWNEELETLMPTNRAENVATNFKLKTLPKNGPMKTRCVGWAGKVLSTFTEKARRVGRTEGVDTRPAVFSAYEAGALARTSSHEGGSHPTGTQTRYEWVSLIGCVSSM